MKSIRQKTRASLHKQPGRPLWLGFADESDGRSLDMLARGLRVITLVWPIILVSRVVLLALAGDGLPGHFAESKILWLILTLCLLVDGAIAAFSLIPRTKLTPNQILTFMLPLVCANGLLWSLAMSEIPMGADRNLAMILGSCVVVATLCSTRRTISIAYVAGALLAGLISGVATPAIIALGVIILAIVAQIVVAFIIGAEKMGTPLRPDLSGEQARALIMEFENSGHGWFWETDRTGHIAYVSHTLASQFARKAEDFAGVPFAHLIGGADALHQSDGQRSLGFHLSARTAFSDIAISVQGADGERWWSISGQPVVTSFGQFLGFRGSGSDLTEKKRSDAEIARLAQFDSLTGLANRLQMMRTLEQTLAPQRGIAGDCALLILDLDRFKSVNDTMGHLAGDALLRQVAQRLLRIIDTDGKVGRLGGDEFQIILPGTTDRGELARLGDRIIHNLSQPYSIEGSQVIIGVSIGVAIAPDDGNAGETLIRNADLALYAAKGDGRGLCRFYMPAMHADAEDRRQLEQDLRQAIATGALHLTYQPVVSASTERISGFEALIRWTHPVRGAISPAIFIPIAEDAGLIDAIGEWVLRTATAEAATWPEGIRVAVNVSPIQFANASLPALVMSALASAGLSASRLELEITESVFLEDETNTDNVFKSLKAIGVRLALDDFGTGYSALGYLKTAPFDKIKIDQSFVRGAAIKGSRNAAIVKSIVSLAEALGMETTAEGAETMDELALIRSLGCSHVQGYIYGQPARQADVARLLTEHGGYAKANGHKASREPRATMLRSVTLIHGNVRYNCRIRNVSPGGAMFDGLTDVPAGTEFAIELTRDYTIRGTVCWAEEDRIGVEFTERVDLNRVRAPIEREPAPVTDVPDFYRDRQRA